MNLREFQGRYRYDPGKDKLGEGGFGSVFKAYDTYRDRWVALKIAKVKPGQEYVRLRREAEMVAKLPLHPNIAYYEECHTFAQMDGEYDFAILQYYAEGNLYRLLEGGALTIVQKEALLNQVLDGVEFLHENGVIHRDLKPQNILIVNRQGEYVPKITDFGISKQLDVTKSSVFSNSLAGAGTPVYASPEQLADKEIRKNTDLWSFGVIAFQVLTGQLPFTTGKHATTSEAGRVELFRQINSGNLLEIIGNIPVGWQNLIRRCLVVDPQRRAKDVTELRDVLGGKRRPVADTPPPPPPPVAPENWFSRYRLIVALACVIVVGIGIFFLYTANNPTPDTLSVEETSAEPVPPPAASVADDTPQTPEPTKPVVTREETRTPEVQTTEREVIRTSVSRTGPAAPPVVMAEIPMVSVRGGTFVMGCTAEQGTDCFDGEKPAHEVTVRDFYIGKYEVTQAEWKAVMGSNSNPSYFKGDNLPVENVSWNEVQEFIRKLNTMTGKNYRLPTEAEWEYAARGGSQSRGFKYSGSNSISDVAWYSENSGSKTHPVGTKRANELGVYDMTGNVWEWVQDGYSSGSQTNPVGSSSGSYRVVRGGSWDFLARRVRVPYRAGSAPADRSSSLGFRLASSSR